MYPNSNSNSNNRFKFIILNMSKLLNTPVKYEIVHLMKNGESSRKTALCINSSFKLDIPHTTVAYIYNKYLRSGHIKNNWNQEGRPRKYDERDARVIVKSALKERRATSFDLANRFTKPIAASTVRRILVARGVKCRTAIQKYVISPVNQKIRVAFAKSHKIWNKENWNKVCFSDESRFELCSSGKVKLRLRRGEEMQHALPKMQMGGGSVMVWGMITSVGVGPLVRVNGTMDQERYIKLLGDHVYSNYPSIFEADGLIYQDDNAPAHRALNVKSWKSDMNMNFMDWPAQSPDLNIIENVWGLLKKRLKGRKFESEDELWDAIKLLWFKIPQEFIDKLYNSCPRRMEEVIKMKGRATKY